MFYTKLGLDHVLDPNATDHILFLAALALPFRFKLWKQLLTLVTIFTVAHCLSLAFSVYEVVKMDSGWIEFLIPITILLTALLNLFEVFRRNVGILFTQQCIATAFFGLIHGFGFSSYFKMMMDGEVEKAKPLLGFATGIEFSQIIVLMTVLVIGFLLVDLLKIPKKIFVVVASLIIVLSTLPMLFNTWPF